MTTYLDFGTGLEILEEFKPCCWVHVECPDEDDFVNLTETLGVPAEFLSDIADTDERPRTEHEDDWQLTILRIPIESSNSAAPYMTVPLGIIAGEQCIVTVCYKKSQMLPDFMKHIRRKGINFGSAAGFITRLIYSSAVWFQTYLKSIYIEVASAESALEKSVKNQDLLRLMRLQKALVYFSTSIQGNEAMLERLRPMNMASNVDPELVDDVRIELGQAQNTVKIYTGILSSMMEAYGSIISNNLNTVMKRMTSISIVLMVPTLVASLYGMNVPLFFSESPLAFPGILIFSLTLSIALFYYFRRIKWF